MSSVRWHSDSSAEYKGSGRHSYHPHQTQRTRGLNSTLGLRTAVDPSLPEQFCQQYTAPEPPMSSTQRSYVPEARNTYFSSTGHNRLPDVAHTRTVDSPDLDWKGRVFYANDYTHQRDAQPRIGYPVALTQVCSLFLLCFTFTVV